MTIEDTGYLVFKRPIHCTNQVTNPRDLETGKMYRWFQGKDNIELIEIVSNPDVKEVWIKRFVKQDKKKKKKYRGRQTNERIESVCLADMGLRPYYGECGEMWHKLNYIVPAE